MRVLAICMILVSTAGPLAAQGNQPAQWDSAVCTFADGRQISVRYRPAPAHNQLPLGQVWAPGNTPPVLFTQADLTIDNSQVPVGAYSLYLMPGQEHWTLIVNKGVDAKSKYDVQKDLLRISMAIGELPQATEMFRIYFVQVAPNQCNMRIYYGESGAWAEIRQTGAPLAQSGP